MEAVSQGDLVIDVIRLRDAHGEPMPWLYLTQNDKDMVKRMGITMGHATITEQFAGRTWTFTAEQLDYAQEQADLNNQCVYLAQRPDGKVEMRIGGLRAANGYSGLVFVVTVQPQEVAR